MKHPSNHLPILLLLLLPPLLHACNGDVFVDEVRLPLTEATLGGDGDTLTLRFNTSEWQLCHAYRGGYGDTYTHYLAGKLYAPDGTDMGSNTCLLDREGKIVVDYPPYELTFIRPNGRELQILLGDNPTNEPFRFTLAVGDKHYFRQEEIHLTQQPGSGYVIDRIAYELIPGSTATEVANNLCTPFLNPFDEPQRYTYDFNKRHHRHINLTCDTPVLLAPTGDGEPTIELPSADISQGIKPCTDRIPYFQYGNALIDMTLAPPYERTLFMPPGLSHIYRVIERQVYQAGYTLYLHNAKTGKPRTVKGTLRSATPTRTLGWYLQDDTDMDTNTTPDNTWNETNATSNHEKDS